MRFCIWGGRRGYIWIGSHEDRVYQMRGALGLMVAHIGERLVPAFRALAKAVQDANRSMTHPAHERARTDQPTKGD